MWYCTKVSLNLYVSIGRDKVELAEQIVYGLAGGTVCDVPP